MEKKFKLIKQFPGCKFDTGKIFGHDFLSQMQTCNPENWPEFFEEIKEPLFVTEDGVELFSYKDKVFCVKMDGRILTNFWYIRDCDLDFIKETDRFKYFSTKEAAEKWIEDNKPVFSKKQIIDAVNQCFHSDYINNRLNEKCALSWYEFKKNLGI